MISSPPRLAIVVLLVAATIAASSLAGAQPPNAADDQAEAPPSTSVGVVPTGVGRFNRGRWAALAVNGTNPTASDTEEVIAVYMGDDSNLQFSKTFWLPAGAKRKTWMPILVPDSLSSDEKSVIASTMRLQQTNGTESFTNNKVGMPISKRPLMLTDGEANTAVIGDYVRPNDVEQASANNKAVSKMLLIGRDKVVRSPIDLGLIDLRQDFLPPTPYALDGLHQLIIASDRIRQDSSGIARIRSWIHQGGRAWIMLDQVDPTFVRELLGDSASYTPIDTVELNGFTIKNHASLSTPENEEVWSQEEPATLHRVIVESAEVTSSVDGWPIAFWKRVGKGEVVFTTLSHSGWVADNGFPTDAHYRLAVRFYQEADPVERQAWKLKPILDDQIGYTIPGRGFATAVLGLNAALILLAGIWWARSRRLERMAALLPVTALLTGGILIGAGNRQVKAVPSTAATGQIIRVDGSIGEVHTSSVSAMYRQSEGDMPMDSAYGTITIPEGADEGSQLKRLRWSDEGTSQWSGLKQPPGAIRYFFSESVAALESPMNVRGTFTEAGFTGSLFGMNGAELSDALVLSVPGIPSAASISTNGNSTTIQSGNDDRLAQGQFVPGALVSDDQRLRQEFLRQVISDPESSPFSSETMMLVWTNPTDIGVQPGDDFTHRGTALAALPIKLDRPSSPEFVIPASFIGLGTYTGTRGVSSIFHPPTGRWLQDVTKAADVELRLEFPKSILPIQLKQINVHLKVAAPSRELVVTAFNGDSPVEVYRQSSPNGEVHFSIDDASLLELDDNGDLKLNVAVTRSENEPEVDPGIIEVNTQKISDTWQIDRFFVDAIGTTSSQAPINAQASTAGK